MLFDWSVFWAHFLPRAGQLLIVGAVIGTNIQWHWTTNGYLATLIGIIAAGMVTSLLVRTAGLLAKLKAAGAARKQKALPEFQRRLGR